MRNLMALSMLLAAISRSVFLRRACQAGSILTFVLHPLGWTCADVDRLSPLQKLTLVEKPLPECLVVPGPAPR